MKTVGQLLKHDFNKGPLRLYNNNGNRIYYEDSNGYWVKRDYDSNCNRIYSEDSTGCWSKREYDSNGKQIYYEDSTGHIEDNRPKQPCEGKVV